MLYRAYLRTFDGRVIDKTVTSDPAAVLVAFEALVNRTDLDGQRILVSLSADGRQVVRHRFDAPAGFDDYWRGRIDEIDLPGLGRAGRPAMLDEGRKISVYLDAKSLARAAELGGGNLSEGIRYALGAAPSGLSNHQPPRSGGVFSYEE